MGKKRVSGAWGRGDEGQSESERGVTPGSNTLEVTLPDSGVCCLLVLI